MIDFTILVLKDAFPSSVALTLDILSTAASIAGRIGSPVPRWRVYSPAGGLISLGNGLSVDTRALPRNVRADRSCWVVPGLGIERPEMALARCLQADAQQAIQALRVQAHAGAMVAASCSAVFLLQRADLLVDKRVTTSWWLAPLLRQVESRCVVDADRMIIADDNLVTAAAALAQSDLVLHLLRVQCSPALADAVARVLLIDGRQSQARVVVPAMFADGNLLIRKLVERFESALPDPPGVSELAKEFCMSERTLARHVRAATGQSTSALLQGVRLQRARMLLESSRLTVEQVAECVGYVDSTALRRLMRKFMGGTPRQFRLLP